MQEEISVLGQEKSGGAFESGRFIGLADMAAAFLPILIFGYLGNLIGLEKTVGGLVVNLGYVVGLVVAGAVLKRRGLSWREIGLERPKSWLRTILFGILALVGAVVTILLAESLVVGLLGDAIAPADISRFDSLVGNVPMFLLMITAAWTTIAFGEEMIYRAFVINRLAAVIGDSRVTGLLTVLGSGFLFGLVHFAEGPMGLVSNGAFGLLFGWIYLKSGRNLWITIIAHGLLNTLRFVLVFSGAA
jgi:membrane protease YdiL (CAAX protease family)